MNVLSIDPGITTGIALSTEFGLEISMTVRKEKILGNGFLTKLIAMTRPDVVLIEGVPNFSPNPEQVALEKELVRWFSVAGFSVYEVQPSQWKGFVSRVEIPGQHARDAATMGRWWIERNAEAANYEKNRQ